MSIFNQVQWGSGDSNPDVFRHQILNLARLPIPALPREKDMILSLVPFTMEMPPMEAPLVLNTSTPSTKVPAPPHSSTRTLFLLLSQITRYYIDMTTTVYRYDYDYAQNPEEEEVMI